MAHQTVATATKFQFVKLIQGRDTRDVARELLHVDELLVDVSGIDLEALLPAAGLRVRIGDKEVGLDKLGTGHQSSVILNLYRQLGAATEQFVLYLFEEPDNHLHPTSLRAIAEDLKQCVTEDHSQAILTTHSPYLLNQFSHDQVLALASDSKRQTVKRAGSVRRSDRDVRVALGKYGLKPAEALLAKKVVVVEGPNDVTLLRTLVELETGLSPDRQDILIVAAGGKQSVADLTSFLRELGANWRVFFDWDAAENTSLPLFKDGLTAEQVASLTSAATTLKSELRVLPTKEGRASKIVDAMLSELGSPRAISSDFGGSILDAFINKHDLLDTAGKEALQKAIRKRQRTKTSKVLSPKGVWLWSATIEEVILHGDAAENDADVVLRGRGDLSQTFANSSDRRPALVNLLHNAAHQPELVRDVVEALWKAKRFDKTEVKAATRFILD